MRVLTGYFDRLVQAIGSIVPFRARGRIVEAHGVAVITEGLSAPIGSNVLIRRADGSVVEGEVVAVRHGGCSLAVADGTDGVTPGAPAEFRAYLPMIGVSDKLLGRTVDCYARPVDGMGPVAGLTPMPLARTSDRPQATERQPLDNPDAPGLFRGAKAVLKSSWPDTGRHLSNIARGHSGPVVAAMIGGNLLEHSVFSADLMDAFYRTVLISEPRERRPYRALRTFRAAASIASYFAGRGEEALLLVSWRLSALPTPTETNAPYDVTSVWSIEEEASGFDMEICPETVTERAA